MIMQSLMQSLGTTYLCVQSVDDFGPQVGKHDRAKQARDKASQHTLRTAPTLQQAKALKWCWHLKQNISVW